jgi:hypothetical protein
MRIQKNRWHFHGAGYAGDDIISSRLYFHALALDAVLRENMYEKVA